MTPGERVLTALNHESPDHTPIDLGGLQTTLSIGAYKALLKHLEWDDLPENVMSKVWQTVFVDERILERFSVDCRHIRPASRVAENSGKSDDYSGLSEEVLKLHSRAESAGKDCPAVRND